MGSAASKPAKRHFNPKPLQEIQKVSRTQITVPKQVIHNPPEVKAQKASDRRKKRVEKEKSYLDNLHKITTSVPESIPHVSNSKQIGNNIPVLEARIKINEKATHELQSEDTHTMVHPGTLISIIDDLESGVSEEQLMKYHNLAPDFLKILGRRYTVPKSRSDRRFTRNPTRNSLNDFEEDLEDDFNIVSDENFATQHTSRRNNNINNIGNSQKNNHNSKESQILSQLSDLPSGKRSFK